MAKNPATKRIHADLRELNRPPISSAYSAAPFEDNLFEWHFTLRGPPATPFAGGVYHGRIVLPSDYPFKPPNIVFLTPNGRFQVGTKICLSISAHHPEQWQPAWGLRLILEALISFFPTEAAGAIGGLDWTPAERARLARASLDYKCPKCGLARDLLPVPQGEGGDGGGNGGAENKYAEQIKELHFYGAPDATPDNTPKGGGVSSGGNESSSMAEAFPAGLDPSTSNGGSSSGGGSDGRSGDGDEQEPLLGARIGRTGPTAAASAASVNGAAAVAAAGLGPSPNAVSSGGGGAVAAEGEDQGEEEEGLTDFDTLMYVSVALAAAIVAIIVRKILRYLGQDASEAGF